ncbi:family 3 O-methyltransferase [Emiliania huxleyi CCMP1516]|uniref:O-methyltransferase n=2 Tax=Emiliania huxleyi TaxID=2903 RepID=A0A0D3KI10_EMIH1|nr:family 3 O-methyltransferase [Emiliania huxleyi CCMP1516]EOD35395.1 family 3 O-methyltransferase [Emiliania huxleyi CCMP1516]|eukprot:XP_005787824.1 family 3 O-methyltransferase [Emiliania huxleyi CCMP1516]
MSFCPVPHTSRDQGWLVTGALLGASAALYARRLYAARSRGQTAKRHGGPTLASADPALYPYLLEKGTRPSEPLQELFAAVEREPRARMMGSPDEAHFLGWLVELMGAKRVLEVGVFRGSTTLALASALPQEGKVVALELNGDFCSTGRRYWDKAGVGGKIDLRLGPASESMRLLLAEGGGGSFDLVFIDANKADYDDYYEQALALLRRGGVVAVDNTLWGGRVLEAPAATADTAAIQAINDKLASDPRVSIVMLGIADGVTLCRKR